MKPAYKWKNKTWDKVSLLSHSDASSDFSKLLWLFDDEL